MEGSRRPILYLVRGWSGAGKTYYTTNFLQQCKVVEANDYFMKEGFYDYDKEKLEAAHSYCLDRAASYLHQGFDVAVTNTFIRRWEMMPYITIARTRGYNVVVIRVSGDYPSPHGVPQEKIDACKRSMQDFTGEILA